MHAHSKCMLYNHYNINYLLLILRRSCWFLGKHFWHYRVNCYSSLLCSPGLQAEILDVVASDTWCLKSRLCDTAITVTEDNTQCNKLLAEFDAANGGGSIHI